MVDEVTELKSSRRSSPVTGRSLAQGVLLLLVVGLCVANGLLITQNRSLKAAIAHMGKPPEVLKPGQRVPPFGANTLSGQRRMVNYADREKTVLLVFSPQCPACERCLPYWREIEAACARNQYQIFGISLADGPKSNAFLMSNGLSLEPFVDVDAEVRKACKLSLTPQTIVIDKNGKVERVWPGAFSPETKQEVERYFGVSVVDDVK